MSENNIKEWLHLHRANLVDSNKRAYKHTRMNTKFFQHNDYNIVDNQEIYLETETLYTIEISETELERIADFENQVFNNLRRDGHFNLFQNVMDQKQREKFLKDKYPAVKKAYEQYSLMLKMAESGEL
jgi:hypothetical protein